VIRAIYFIEDEAADWGELQGGSQSMTERTVIERAHDKLDKRRERFDKLGVTLGQSAIKLLVLINGGAIAAVLSFIGSLLSKSGTTADSEKILSITKSLLPFASGVGAAGVAIASGYIANYMHVLSLQKELKTDSPPYVVTTPEAEKRARWANFCHGFGTVVGLASLALFIWGVWRINHAIAQLVAH
jgi:hypothetical protein